MKATNRRPLVALFRAAFGCSRLQEFESVAKSLQPDADHSWTWDNKITAFDGGDIGPALIQRLPEYLKDSDWTWLTDTCARSIGCKSIFELWAQGDTLEECAEKCAEISTTEILKRIKGSWRMHFSTLGANTGLSTAERTERIEIFAKPLACLSQRTVSLNSPQHTLWLIENRQRLKDYSPLPNPPPRHMLLYKLPPTNESIQSLAHRLDVKRRPFISTSTLPSDRALSLCNLAGIMPGDTILDPYCGSGGILIAAAALGAATVGSDIDWRPLSKNRIVLPFPSSPNRTARGQEKVCIYDNFLEQDLQRPKELLVLDTAAPHAADRLLSANSNTLFDALICDPPYGRREFQQGRYSWDSALSYKVDEDALQKTITQLLSLSQKTLRPNGKLVFLVPIWTPKDAMKPTLKQLSAFLNAIGHKYEHQLIHTGKEVVSQSLNRAVVSMQKRVT